METYRMSYFTAPQLRLLIEADVDLRQAERAARTGGQEEVLRYLNMVQRSKAPSFSGDPVGKQAGRLKKAGWRHRRQLVGLEPVLVTVTHDPICDDPEHVANPELCGEGYTSDQAVEGVRNLVRARGYEVGEFEVHYEYPNDDGDGGEGYLIGHLEVDQNFVNRLIEDGYIEMALGDDSIHLYAEMP